jgi:hypothetical protein
MRLARVKKSLGMKKRNDDEWYTTDETARALAGWLARNLPLTTCVLCPADILPDGSESEIPKAIRKAGFVNVRVTRNLPHAGLIDVDYIPGEVIVTNPPFSLIVAFRNWAKNKNAKFCILARPGAMRNCWPVPELKEKFKSMDGRAVAAAWMQNIVDTTVLSGVEIGNCSLCESKKCPKNEMTGEFTPRVERKLYGWCEAVKNGSAGNFCNKYTINGRGTFLRFFHGAGKC